MNLLSELESAANYQPRLFLALISAQLSSTSWVVFCTFLSQHFFLHFLQESPPSRLPLLNINYFHAGS